MSPSGIGPAAGPAPAAALSERDGALAAANGPPGAADGNAPPFGAVLEKHVARTADAEGQKGTGREAGDHSRDSGRDVRAADDTAGASGAQPAAAASVSLLALVAAPGPAPSAGPPGTAAASDPTGRGRPGPGADGIAVHGIPELLGRATGTGAVSPGPQTTDPVTGAALPCPAPGSPATVGADAPGTDAPAGVTSAPGTDAPAGVSSAPGTETPGGLADTRGTPLDGLGAPGPAGPGDAPGTGAAGVAATGSDAPTPAATAPHPTPTALPSQGTPSTYGPEGAKAAATTDASTKSAPDGAGSSPFSPAGAALETHGSTPATELVAEAGSAGHSDKALGADPAIAGPTASPTSVTPTPTAPSTASAPAQPIATAAPAAPNAHPGVDLAHTIERVRATIELAARQGASQARIELSPASLGSIRIHLTRTPDGLIARVMAEHSVTAQTLQHNGAELRRSLEATGLPLLRLDIESSEQQGPGAQGSGLPTGDRTHRGRDDGHDEHRGDGGSGSGGSGDGITIVLPGASSLVNVLA